MIHPSPAGPSGHLMKFRGSQRQKFPAVEPVRIEKNNGSGRKIYPRGHSRGCKHRVQKPLCHKGLNDQFPCRQLSAVMGPDSQIFKLLQMAVPCNMFALSGKFLNPLTEPGLSLRIIQ